MYFLPALATGLAMYGTVAAYPHERREVSGLHAAATEAGVHYFGTAVDNPAMVDAAYVKTVQNKHEFGSITPENALKMSRIHPQQGRYEFAKGDAIVAMARHNGQLIRCHALVYYQNVPTWIKEGTWTKASLTKVLEDHIKTVVTHYKGKCNSWDVVNEAINKDGNYRKGEDIFYDTIGPDYIPLAFRAAAAADPAAKLFYNEYAIYDPNAAKTIAVRKLVTSLKRQGVKIDGVGLQCHFAVGKGTPSTADQKKNMAAFTALGVLVAISELDVSVPLPSSEAKLALQRKNYADTIAACVQTMGCFGVTVWGFTDKYSWIPEFSDYLKGTACPWDRAMKKKPAYYGILDGFRDRTLPGKAAGVRGGVKPVTGRLALGHRSMIPTGLRG